MNKKLSYSLVCLSFGSAALIPGQAIALPTCTQLGTDPAHGLAVNPQIVAATPNSVIIPPATSQSSRIPASNGHRASSARPISAARAASRVLHAARASVIESLRTTGVSVDNAV
jgi:hypothetical protein